MPETLGTNTPNALWNKSQSHKLSEEFVVKAAETVYAGQPVKLHTDGTILPFVAADSDSLRIGTALHNGAAGERVTVVLKANAIVRAIADGDTDAGPVKYTSFDTAEKKPKYSDAAVTADITSGWALDSVLDGEEVRVAIL